MKFWYQGMPQGLLCAGVDKNIIWRNSANDKNWRKFQNNISKRFQ
jgi:hypothetical protein